MKLTSDKNSKPTLVDAEFSLEKLKLQKLGQSIKHLSLSENDDIFDNVSKETSILIEHTTSFKSSEMICKSFGGTLFVPLDDKSFEDTFSLYLKAKEKCSRGLWLGIKKSVNNKDLVDLQGVS